MEEIKKFYYYNKKSFNKKREIKKKKIKVVGGTWEWELMWV